MAIPKLVDAEDVKFFQTSPTTIESVYLPEDVSATDTINVEDFQDYPYGESELIKSKLIYPVIDQASGEMRPGTAVLPLLPVWDATTGTLETIESKPRESVSPYKNFTEAYEGVDYVPFNPSNYAAGSVIVSSGDYPQYAPGPVIEAVIGGTKAIFVGTKACEDAKELVINQKMGTFYGDSLFYMLSPTIVYTGPYNCLPCDPWCCIANCVPPPTESADLFRKHKEYYRVYAFATFIYDLQDEGRKYESINSNVVVVRTNGLPITFDIIYIPAGVTHIRYWSKNEKIFCYKEGPPCPWFCGKEVKSGGDNEFFLRDEIEIPKQYRKKVGEL